MFDTLFGEGQYGLKMLFAFIVVFGLLALALWLVRRFGGERLGNTTTRGRQPRLAVIDAATVDGRRRLVLIRRDNVEHLLMIGGPTDVVVEPNIVRVVGAQREAPPVRPPAATETLPRAVPLGEGTMWPLQPEPAPRPEPTLGIEPPPRAAPAPRPQRPPPQPPAVEEPTQWSEPEPTPPLPPARERERRPRTADPLAGLAEDLSRAPAAPEAAPIEQPVRQAPRREPRAPRPQPAPPPAPAPAAEADFNSSADQNLAEMAQRLEAALRRPVKNDDGRSAPGAPKAAPAPAGEEEEYAAAPSPPPARPAPPPDSARPARGDARPARAGAQPAPQKSLYDSLEQEMASLLGRPNNKP
jgi:hypothetical protein